MLSNRQILPFSGQRIVVSTKLGFDELLRRLRARMAAVSFAELSALASDRDAYEAEVRKRTGPSGFMLFAKIDHGRWLDKFGIRRRTVRWIFGNPLTAETLIRHDITAGLFAPVEMLITEEEDGSGTTITYVRPSTLMVIAENPPLGSGRQGVGCEDRGAHRGHASIKGLLTMSERPDLGLEAHGGRRRLGVAAAAAAIRSADTTASLSEFLCFAVYSANLAFGKAYKPLLEELGLTYTQWIILVALWERDDRTVGSLGEQLFLKPNTLTPILKKLEEQGYLRRRRDPADARQVLISLTEAGRRLREKGQERRRGGVATGLTPEELKMLQRTVVRLRDNLVENARA